MTLNLWIFIELKAPKIPQNGICHAIFLVLRNLFKGLMPGFTLFEWVRFDLI